MTKINLKISIAFLGTLFVILQYYLWFAKDSVTRMIHLKHEIALQQNQNDNLAKKNLNLKTDIKELKNGTNAIEQHARSDLGMIKKGEVFYQIIK